MKAQTEKGRHVHMSQADDFCQLIIWNEGDSDENCQRRKEL